jgi:hypothetical protein
LLIVSAAACAQDNRPGEITQAEIKQVNATGSPSTRSNASFTGGGWIA